MTDREVQSVRDLIYYQYSKIIARSAFGIPNGNAAKARHYGFIKKTFRQMKTVEKSWSEIIREDRQFVEAEKRCAYCGVETDLHWEHHVPQSVHINDCCPNCLHILGIHNQLWACRNCDSSKGTNGLYEFYQFRFSDDPKYYDMIPPLLEKKHLKTIYCCHECAGTLDSSGLGPFGVLTVLDIDAVLRTKDMLQHPLANAERSCHGACAAKRLAKPPKQRTHLLVMST